MNDLIQLREKLTEIWGYDDFRHPQGEVIQSILQGKDSLTVMPTGGGKSLCFQLPALLQKGLTLVISPLVALMENQVQELWQKKLPADILHSEIPSARRRVTINKIQNNQLRLLYLSPETLLSAPLWQLITRDNVIINGIIIDEAHCLIQWGNTFRPAYTRLGGVRWNLGKNPLPPLACFTATADTLTRQQIIETLQLQQPQQFLVNPYKSNLQLEIKQIWTPKGRKNQVIQLLEKNKNKSGLIYLRTRKEAENLSNFLTNLGYKNNAYHAGLPSIKRRQIEQDWLAEKTQFVVSTNAFGMGINKANLRWILHYQTPLLLSEYIQEIGRGGRDGKITQAISLISEKTGIFDPTDKQRQQYFLTRTLQQYQQAEKFMKKLPPQENINNLLKITNNQDYQIYLAILASSKQLQWQDPFNYKLTVNNSGNAIKEMIKREQKLAQNMQNYLQTTKCRWYFLLNAFGFDTPINFRCGKCDNCSKTKAS